MSRAGDWVKVAQVENEVAAALALGVLREAGIPCFARPAGAGVGYFSPTSLPHLVFVPRDQLPRAKELLSAAGEDISPEAANEAA